MVHTSQDSYHRPKRVPFRSASHNLATPKSASLSPEDRIKKIQTSLLHTKNDDAAGNGVRTKQLDRINDSLKKCEYKYLKISSDRNCSVDVGFGGSEEASGQKELLLSPGKLGNEISRRDVSFFSLGYNRDRGLGGQGGVGKWINNIRDMSAEKGKVDRSECVKGRGEVSCGSVDIAEDLRRILKEKQ